MDTRETPQTPPSQTETRPAMSGARTRQGVTGHNVRYVLGFGLAGVVIAFIIIYIVFFAPHLGS
jgi:hypothetical protein